MFLNLNRMTARWSEAKPTKRRFARRPSIEDLEERQLLSTIVQVGNNANGTQEVYALGADEKLYGHPQGGGWQCLSATGQFTQIVANGDTVYALGADQTLESYTPAGGWQSMSSTGRFNEIAASGGTVYAIGTDQKLYAKPQGAAWQCLSATGRFTQVVAGGGTVYALGTDQVLYAQAQGGAWQSLSSTGRFTQIAASGGTIYGIGTDQKLYAQAQGGAWQCLSTTGQFTQVVAAGGTVYALGTDQILYAESQGGAWRCLSTTGRFTQIAAGIGADGTLEVCGMGTDHLLYILRESPGGGWGSWSCIATPTPMPTLTGPSASSPNGEWTVTLEQEAPNFSGTTIYAEVVNNQTGFEKMVAAVGDSNETNPLVAVSNSGNFVVAYQHTNLSSAGVPSLSLVGSAGSAKSIDIDSIEFFYNSSLPDWYGPSGEVPHVVVSDKSFNFIKSLTIDGAGNYVVGYLADTLDSQVQGTMISQSVTSQGQNGPSTVTGALM